MSSLKKLVGFLFAVVLLPSVRVRTSDARRRRKDPSGAVLPGVTIEASSSALIEKTRSATTDGTGQYRIVDLPPGSYALTFTLSGFSTVKREDVNVSGAGVITINADLKVGAVSETITVSGETPVVDVQSATRQAVLKTKSSTNFPWRVDTERFSRPFRVCRARGPVRRRR